MTLHLFGNLQMKQIHEDYFCRHIVSSIQVFLHHLKFQASNLDAFLKFYSKPLLTDEHPFVAPNVQKRDITFLYYPNQQQHYPASDMLLDYLYM